MIEDWSRWFNEPATHADAFLIAGVVVMLYLGIHLLAGHIED